MATHPPVMGHVPAPPQSAFSAPGGSAQALLDALRERLSACVQEMRLPTDVPGEPERAPIIFDGDLPYKRGRGQDVGEFPFVLVRPSRGSDAAQDDASITVRMVIGVYSDRVDGYRDWMAVKERIRIDLLGNPVIDGRFRLQHPFLWDLADDQPRPQWVGVIEVGFTLPGIVDNTWGEIL